MTRESERIHARLPLFDPAAGRLIREPEASEKGYWVGAPAVTYDASRKSFLLCYRRRRPRDVSPDRGYEAAIAESRDGLEFEDIWRMSKDKLRSSSIEKCSLVRTPEGSYRYYLSYVDPVDNRWRTDVVEARSPEEIDVSQRREVFTAASATRRHHRSVEGVKDPAVYLVGRLYYMFLSYAEGMPLTPQRHADMHRTGDVYTTGMVTAHTALATSEDGIRFRWNGRCLSVGARGAWDGYQTRLNSVLRHEGLWYGFYDGSRSREENYEERFGLAQSFNLRRWEKVTRSGPAITVPHGSGSVRYTEAARVGEAVHYYYEVARQDGAHELRCAVVGG